MDYMFSVVIFSIAASITPGPNTLLALASGLKFGGRKSLPLLFGISVGFSLMLMAVGVGLEEIFNLFPQLSIFMKVAGIIYLLYLAWVIAQTNVLNSQESCQKPISFYKGVLFQWINVKAWVVCLGAISAFTLPGEFYFRQTLLIATSFLFVGLPCVALWIFAGSFLKQYLNNPVLIRRLNLLMSFLLVTSILPVLIPIP